MRKKTDTLLNETDEKNIKKSKHSSQRDIRWERLDNTAHLFPAIAGENMTNVYRISVTLTELINPEILQDALNTVLPKFDGFNLRLRKGVFWYYFEENGKPAPKVTEESLFPCRYIKANKNRSYLFNVTYYKYRINLEVFHVLTDGMGALTFLKELTYQYLRMLHPELMDMVSDTLDSYTSLNREDSFLKNYRKSSKNIYQKKKAFLIKGEKLRAGEFGVMHGYLKTSEIKELCKKYETSINEFLVGTYIWSIYSECLNKSTSKLPVRVAVPVNLRPFFDSITTKNFFAMVSAEFSPSKEDYSFKEVLDIVKKSLRNQINKEHLEKLFSYNVSNEKIWIARAVPLVFKNMAMRYIYNASALANTSTVTNLGNISIADSYKPFVEGFHVCLSVSKGQNIKGTICSYKDTLVFSFSYVLKDPSVQRCFFQTLAKEGLSVEIESNGVHYE